MSDFESSDDQSASRGIGQRESFHGIRLPAMPSQINLGHLERLYHAAAQGDRALVESTIHDLLSDGVDAEEIADLYIPTASRIMGEAWCEDLASFAEVTIGGARLQAALRLLGPAWTGDDFADPNAPTVLLIVGYDVYHTLGASVLAGQLRRRGLSVRLSVGQTNEGLSKLLADGSFDAVFLSASCGESLESLRVIVKIVRAGVRTGTKIVVGGSILETDNDVGALTGADHTTVNVDEAINFCGLKTKLHKTQLAGK